VPTSTVDHRADRGAADDQHLMGDGVHDGAEIAAGDHESPERHHQAAAPSA